MEILRLKAYTDNYIWGLREKGQLTVIDPGESAPVFQHLRESGDQLAAILLTHHHGDHIDGTTSLLAKHPVPVLGPQRKEIPFISRGLVGGETLELPGLSEPLSVMAVPGHTADHLAYYAAPALFCGDTLFNLGCGRVFDSSAATLFQSLQSIAGLPDDTQIYCAHEYTHLNLPFALEVDGSNPALQARAILLRTQMSQGVPTVPTRLGDERETNPFLRCHTAPVQEFVARLGAAPLHQPIEFFAALRQWRNGYKPSQTH